MRATLFDLAHQRLVVAERDVDVAWSRAAVGRPMTTLRAPP